MVMMTKPFMYERGNMAKNYDRKSNPDCMHMRLRLEVKDNDDLTENRIDFE